MNIEDCKRFIAAFMSALSTFSLYSEGHPAMAELTMRALTLLQPLFTEEGMVKLMLIDDGLVVNNIPVKEAGIHGKNLIKRFKKKGITRVDFSRDTGIGEFRKFVAEIAGTGDHITSQPHIRAGLVSVETGKGYETSSSNLSDEGIIPLEVLDEIRDRFSSLSAFKKLDTRGLEEIVVNFIVTFKREANILRLISPVRSYSEYTYTHATNVSILTMVQAESLGVSGKTLHEVGIAALLHDVGKLFISKEILEKKSKLTEEEFQEITMHTVYGARYLTRNEDITPLAAIAAYGHHLRFDGKGYPKKKYGNKRQHLCCQIIQISDFYDALRSKRPYKKDWEVKEILALMKENAGEEFNPSLVDNFSRIITTVLPDSH